MSKTQEKLLISLAIQEQPWEGFTLDKQITHEQLHDVHFECEQSFKAFTGKMPASVNLHLNSVILHNSHLQYNPKKPCIVTA